ncbi:MAG: phosphoglucosamine mutase [Candidatus Aminicenantes bacterium]
MDKLFGTDGIRAVAGQFPLDYPSVHTLGRALVNLLEEKGYPPRVIIGKDTRESGTWLEQALIQGISSNQGKAVSAGIIPTSAVSYLTRKHSFSAGIVISASHNPYQDNGIKIFSSQGIKIPEEWEEILEKSIQSSQEKVQTQEVKITPSPAFRKDYMDFLISRFSQANLPRKIKLVVDCSNGASSLFAPQVFKTLGFDVITHADCPDGRNINARCGSLYPQGLAGKVVESKADMGVAYDGDADRAIWVDERGRILNGDHTLFVLSRFMKERDGLKSDYVVATTMSNLGLEKALDRLNLKLFRTKVGDKYVLEQMMKLQANLGGEQSGHTIFLDDCPTGDGILTSIKMLEVMAAHNASLSELVKDYQEFPQILVNVKVARKDDFHRFPEINNAVEEIKRKLGNSGRLLLRYSGTEPVVRIMMEGKDKELIGSQAQKIARLIEQFLGV